MSEPAAKFWKQECKYLMNGCFLILCETISNNRCFERNSSKFLSVIADQRAQFFFVVFQTHFQYLKNFWTWCWDTSKRCLCSPRLLLHTALKPLRAILAVLAILFIIYYFLLPYSPLKKGISPFASIFGLGLLHAAHKRTIIWYWTSMQTPIHNATKLMIS